MTSKRQNSSKTTYKGQNIRRLPRSELEDNTVRDLNRFDNRLDHNLRIVEKAKEVMLKSWESDKQLFMRGGVRSNKRYTVPMQNPGDSRQRIETVASTQPSKYHSDTRNKKPHAGDTAAGQKPPGSRPDASSNTTISRNDNHRDILAETREIIEQQSGGEELVDDFLSNHRGGASMEGRGQGQGQTKKKTKFVERQSSRADLVTESNPVLNGKPGYRSTTTPTIKVDDYDVYYDEKTKTTSAQPLTFYEDYSGTGRKYDFWDYLSTPKNPSRSLQKREQLEREFSSPMLKTRATTPATKSAKGQRSYTSYPLLPSSTTSSTSPTTKSPTSPRAKSASGKKTSSASPTISVKNGSKTSTTKRKDKS